MNQHAKTTNFKIAINTQNEHAKNRVSLYGQGNLAEATFKVLQNLCIFKLWGTV